jgi:hypothetical protein
MPDDVPREVKMERLRAVEELQACIAGEINSGLLGRTVEVLVEEEKGGKLGGPARPLGGRTRSGKLVHFSGTHPEPVEGAAVGDLVLVLIERTSPWSLQGRLASAATPRKAGGEPASLSTRLTGPANPLDQRRASIRGRSRAEKARPSCPPAGGGLAQASLKAGLQRDRDLVHHGTSSG